MSKLFRKLDSLFLVLFSPFRFRYDDRLIKKAISGKGGSVVPILDSGMANRFRTFLGSVLNFKVNSYQWQYWSDHRIGPRDKHTLNDYFDNLDLERVYFSNLFRKYFSIVIPLKIDSAVSVLDFELLNFGGLTGRPLECLSAETKTRIQFIFWDLLRPKKDVLDRVEEVTRGLSHISCLHLRSWEFCDSKETLLKRNELQHIKILISPEKFRDSIKDCLERLPDETTLFVCSAYPFSLEDFDFGFDFAIKTVPTLFDETYLQDFFELLLLTQAHCLIGTRYSTFSHLAKIVSKVNVSYQVFD